VLQPLLVRRMDDGYQLIAGERRLTAAREAGLEEVPAVVMELDDREALEVALVENLQREDLNLIEEAEGYQALCEEFNMTQEQVAERVGKARASVTNALRLLKLPGDVRELISQKQLSAGHAKVLLGLEIPEEQGRWAQRVVREDMSVRELEKQMTRAHRPRRRKRTSQSDLPEEHMRYLIDQLHQHLGTSVRIAPCRTLANGKKTTGCIEIDFYSGDELDRILQMLGFTDSV
jgi:ParB family chromosome partitioning protein